MPTVTLPAYAYEDQLTDLLESLGTADGHQEAILDFQQVTFWTPGALVLLLAKARHWHSRKMRVVFLNCKTCPALRYLQRIDFFSQCGIQLSPSGTSA